MIGGWSKYIWNTLREGIVAEINVLNLVGALPEGMGRGP